MLKQKVQKISIRSVALLAALVLLVAGISSKGFGVMAATCSSSADCQQQIQNLNSQNSQAEQSINMLEAQASSYQDAINQLDQQINNIQQQIVASQNQEDALQAQIVQVQANLDQQKKVLGENIKQMYLEGQVSTLEILASSNNLSDFVNKEVDRSVVQDKVKGSVDTITALKLQLQQQQSQVEQLLSTQQAQRSQLADDEAQQSQLLGYNEDQQAQFDQQIQSNKQALNQLYAQQAAIIAASFGGSSGLHYGGTGGYPWDNAVCLNYSGDCSAYSSSPYNWGLNGYPYDPAGWQYRNCTSYAFWRLAQATGQAELTWNFFPTVYGNNGEIKYSVWGSNGFGTSGSDFSKLGYTVDHDPNGAAVLAVNSAGTFGHIMYVEGVVNGQAVVSQYNAAGDGRYSTGTLSPGSNIWFVHIE